MTKIKVFLLSLFPQMKEGTPASIEGLTNVYLKSDETDMSLYTREIAIKLIRESMVYLCEKNIIRATNSRLDPREVYINSAPDNAVFLVQRKGFWE